LTDDETYKKLYPQDQGLDGFYKIAFIGKKVDNIIKSIGKYQLTQKSDIKFYVIYAVFSKILRKGKISIKDAASIDLSLFSENLITDTTDEVFRLYIQLGGNDKIAKGTDFVISLRNQLRNLLTEEKYHAGSV
jgi:hypothetical protein